MGGCFSDLKGGKEAVGGLHEAATGTGRNNDGTHNDAVDLFYKTQGFPPKFNQVDVEFDRTKQAVEPDRFSGTIVGVGDVSPGWSNSQWQ
ncbi:BONZAI 3 [Spatholobus suberectus]|nr:BONZAI 3 [Spatholobus suberectus]